MEKDKISKQIGDDVQKFASLIAKLNENPSAFEQFVHNPVFVLDMEGINLSNYTSDTYAQDKLAEDVVKIIEMGMVVGKTSAAKSSSEGTPRSYSSSSMQWNYDHSSSSSTDYSPYTSSSPGARSETSRGRSVSSETLYATVSKLSQPTTEAKLNGPLISPAAIQAVLDNVKNALAIKRS